MRACLLVWLIQNPRTPTAPRSRTATAGDANIPGGVIGLAGIMGSTPSGFLPLTLDLYLPAKPDATVVPAAMHVSQSERHRRALASARTAIY